MLPAWLQTTFDVLASLLRFVGLLVFGLGSGWLVLEFLRKGAQAWQLQIALFLGFVGLGIAMARFLSAGALAGFAIGAGVALFIWGMPKPKAKDDDEKPAKK